MHPMDYPLLHFLHVLTVCISLALFLLRGIWMLREPDRLRARWVRVVPHVNDSLLLASAIALAVVLQLDPRQQPWLLAKIVALLAYIVAGSIALKRGRSRAVRVTALIAAIVLFGYIVRVAMTKNVFPGVI